MPTLMCGAGIEGAAHMVCEAVEAGLFIYIMVASMEAIVEAIASAGGEVVQWLTPGTPEIARFRDPAGNVIGLYHHPGL